MGTQKREGKVSFIMPRVETPEKMSIEKKERLQDPLGGTPSFLTLEQKLESQFLGTFGCVKFYHGELMSIRVSLLFLYLWAFCH